MGMETDILGIGSDGAARCTALAADAFGAEVLIKVKGTFAKIAATFYSAVN